MKECRHEMKTQALPIDTCQIARAEPWSWKHLKGLSAFKAETINESCPTIVMLQDATQLNQPLKFYPRNSYPSSDYGSLATILSREIMNWALTPYAQH